MSTDAKGVRRRLSRRGFAQQLALVSLLAIATGCGDKYEPTRPIEGLFQPNGCAHLEGRRDGWVLLSTVHIKVCQPIRVNELGVMTYGWEVSQPGWKAEVGRLDYSDGGVFIVTERLKQYGRFDYSERPTTFNDWMRHNPATAAVLGIVALLLAVAIPLRVAASIARAKREAERLEAAAVAQRDRIAREAAAQRDRLAAEAAARAAARAAALARLRQLVSEAQGAAASLPIILGEAELTVDRAEDELRDGLFSPFWEAVEAATAKLDDFHQMLLFIEANRATYNSEAAMLGSDAPAFSLGVSVLPDPQSTHSRLIGLYRKAQANPHFAMVYEQRRTSAILIAGFSSLGQAIEQLGSRVVNAIGGLADSLDCRLASLESSLESTAIAAAEQSAALREEIQQATGANDAVLRQLRGDAEARSKSERLALRMLDNIQSRRKPTMWDRP